jgi:hypothetical protein
MPAYTYLGPTVRLPVGERLLLLVEGKTYDLPAGFESGLMDRDRLAKFGKLVKVEPDAITVAAVEVVSSPAKVEPKAPAAIAPAKKPSAKSDSTKSD